MTLHPLRDYQTDFVADVATAFGAGFTSVCGVLPTGAGKTRCAVELCLRHLAIDDRRRSVVWLAPYKELARQAREAFPSDVSVVTATDRTEMQDTLFARVHVSTVHALANTGYRPRASLVVLDEGHFFFGTPSWNAVAQWYRAHGAIVLALTATPTRVDGTALSTLSDRIVQGPDIADLVARWRRTGEGLVPPRVFAPATRLDRGGDAVQAYLDFAPDTKAVVFCVDRNAARMWCEKFQAAGVTAAWADADHRDGLALHRAGAVRVLCNVFLVSVGYDDPSIDTVIWARGVGSRATYIQGNGRALRPAASKTHATILDLYGNVHQHGLPTERLTYSLEGRAIQLQQEKPAKIAACPDCHALYRPGATACACSPAIRPLEPVASKPLTPKQAARLELQRIHATEPEAIKRMFYERLQAQAKAEQWSRWRAAMQFKGRYGHLPPRTWKVT